MIYRVFLSLCLKSLAFRAVQTLWTRERSRWRWFSLEKFFFMLFLCAYFLGILCLFFSARLSRLGTEVGRIRRWFQWNTDELYALIESQSLRSHDFTLQSFSIFLCDFRVFILIGFKGTTKNNRSLWHVLLPSSACTNQREILAFWVSLTTLRWTKKSP